MLARLRRPALSLALLTSVLVSSVALGQAQQLPVSDTPADPGPAAAPAPTTGPSADGQSVASAALAPSDDPTASQYPHVNGPDYGMNIFIWGTPETTDRDLAKVTDAHFSWQKTLFQWRSIEPSRGTFDWTESDRVVAASAAVGVKVIARLDFQPSWARADGDFDGPPDDYDDFGAFVYAFADRYKPGSPYGTVSAIEMWNEPNLWRDWGSQPIGPASAADYVRLLCTGYQAAKKASSDIIVISAALTPTGTLNSEAADDVVYTQWMYDAGAKPCFDVLGAHGAGYKAPPWIGPAELATNPKWGGDQSFGFRRTEQLRDVMVRNGDGGKQIWLTEFGWSSDTVHPSYAWHRVSEDEKADYVVEAYRWAYLHWKPWIGVMVLWNIAAPDWTEDREEYWWSVTNADGTTRPAYDALVTARASGYLPDAN